MRNWKRPAGPADLSFYRDPAERLRHGTGRQHRRPAGQKQLLTIARAMVQDNPMLILDEGHLFGGHRTELITIKAMDQLTEHRTSFCDCPPPVHHQER